MLILVSFSFFFFSLQKSAIHINFLVPCRPLPANKPRNNEARAKKLFLPLFLSFHCFFPHSCFSFFFVLSLLLPLFSLSNSFATLTTLTHSPFLFTPPFLSTRPLLTVPLSYPIILTLPHHCPLSTNDNNKEKPAHLHFLLQTRCCCFGTLTSSPSTKKKNNSSVHSFVAYSLAHLHAQDHNGHFYLLLIPRRTLFDLYFTVLLLDLDRLHLPLKYTPTTRSKTSEKSIAMNHSGALSQGDPSGTSQDEHMDAAASFAHSLSVAPLDSASTIHSISLALNGSNYTNGDEGQHDTDVLMMDATTRTITTSSSASSVSTSAFHFQQPESRMAVAELLVSLGQSSRSVE